MVEQSSPARVSGRAFRKVTLNGKEYLLSQPWKVGIYADMEAFILGRRKDAAVFGVQASRLMEHDAERRIMWEGLGRAVQNGFVTQDEWDAFNSSPWRAAFSFWKALDPKHLEEVPTVEDALKLIGEAVDMDELMAKVRLTSQEDELKNSHGRSEAPAESHNQEIPTSPDGPPSTNSSENATAGPETT